MRLTGGLRRLLVAGSVAAICQLSLYNYSFQHLSGEIIANHTRAVDAGGKNINVVDTAIIISSSWIPTHPSTYMVKTVVDSIVMITGLHPATPIFITVDQFRLNVGNVNITQIQERSRSLDQYVLNLYNLYLKDPYVHVLPLMTHSHIAGSVAKALGIIKKQYSLTKYLYYLQHDFNFVKTVDHSMLVRAMETRDEINYILFLKSGLKRVKSCGNESTIDLDTLDHVPRNDTNINPNSTKRLLLPTATYSDNNHFVRFDWYKETIESLISLARPPEDPLQKRARDGCRSGKSMGLYAYDEGYLIRHLDGRTTQDAEY